MKEKYTLLEFELSRYANVQEVLTEEALEEIKKQLVKEQKIKLSGKSVPMKVISIVENVVMIEVLTEDLIK